MQTVPGKHGWIAYLKQDNIPCSELMEFTSL